MHFIYIYVCVSYCVIYPTVWSLSQHVSPFFMDFFYGEISWNPQDFPPARHPGHQGSRLKPCASSWTLLRKCRALQLDVLKYPPEKNKVDPGIGVGRLVKPLKHGDSQDELLIYQMVNHLLSYCGWLRNPAPWMVETLQRDKPPINWCSISRPPTVGSWHLLI